MELFQKQVYTLNYIEENTRSLKEGIYKYHLDIEDKKTSVLL